jgi:hypothetical protein
MSKVKSIIVVLAFFVPLLYVCYFSYDILKSYDGRCAGLLDAVGPECSKSEYVLDFLFNAFVFPVLASYLFVYELALGVGYILVVYWERFRKK